MAKQLESEFRATQLCDIGDIAHHSLATLLYYVDLVVLSIATSRTN